LRIIAPARITVTATKISVTMSDTTASTSPSGSKTNRHEEPATTPPATQLAAFQRPSRAALKRAGAIGHVAPTAPKPWM